MNKLNENAREFELELDDSVIIVNNEESEDQELQANCSSSHSGSNSGH